ncbi:MAG: Gfo/Idh/MocA family oxidoreductase [Gemmatimonadota bacterium]
MSMTPTVSNVGLIGFGLGGATFHAPFIARTPGLRLAAVMTSDPARRAAVEREYPDTVIVSDFAELMAQSPKLDLVAISTPNGTHYPLARAVLEAGCHVVVDKPFAATASQARDLASIAAAAGRRAFPFQNRRWDGDYLTLRKLIADGALGEIHRFESRFDRWRVDPKPGWCRPDARERTENIVHDLATHLIDQSLCLFGPVASVYAELRRVRPKTESVDDAFIALTHESGVCSHLTMTIQAGILPARMSVFGARGAYVKFGVDVQEEQLRAGVRPDTPGYGDDPEERWGAFGAGEDKRIIPTLRGDYSPFYLGVARAIREGAPSPVAIPDVVTQLEIVEAAFRSAESGMVEFLSPIRGARLSLARRPF